MDILVSVGSWVAMFFFFAIMILSLFSLIIGLPGNWIILAETLIYGAITKWEGGIAGYDLLVLLAFVLTGEALEFILTARGAKKHGGSNWAIVMSLLGGIVGAILIAILIPIIGAVIGAFLGVFFGAFLFTYASERDLEKARQVGLGAFKGRLGSVLVKGTMGVSMAAVIITQIF
jgi:uncharacterized protein YqgC (DUF456 family)